MIRTMTGYTTDSTTGYTTDLTTGYTTDLTTGYTTDLTTGYTTDSTTGYLMNILIELYRINAKIKDLNTKLVHNMKLLDISQSQLNEWLGSLQPSFQCYDFWMQEVIRHESLLNDINISTKNVAQRDFISLNKTKTKLITKHVYVLQELQNVTKLLQSHEPETYRLKMKLLNCQNNIKILKEELRILTTSESNLLTTLPLSDLQNLVDQSNTAENNRLESELGPIPNCKDQKRALEMVLVKLLPPNINPNTSNINHLPSNLSINDLCLLIKLIGKLIYQRYQIDQYWLERNKKAKESNFVTYINSILTLKHAIALNEDKRALLFLQNQLKIAWVRP